MKLSYSDLQRLFYLVWHHGFVFFQTIRALPPILIWCLMIGIFYDYRYPLNIVQAYVTAAPWLFFVMVWFSYLFLSGFNQTAEYIMILQINSRKLYASSKFIFLLVICIALSILACIYPIIIDNILRLKGVTYFTEDIQLTDFFGSLFLHIIYGVLGVALSILFQPNLTKQRDDFSLTMLIIFTILSYAKFQLVDIYSWFRYFLWVFPPVIDIAHMFKGDAILALSNLSLAALYGLIYSVLAVAVGQWIYSLRLYRPRIAAIEKQNRIKN